MVYRVVVVTVNLVDTCDVTSGAGGGGRGAVTLGVTQVGAPNTSAIGTLELVAGVALLTCM